jgi:glycosyltransferase involved in cell wall biosynthesis
MNVGGPARQITGLSAALDPERYEQRLLAGEDAAGEADFVSLAAPHLEVVRVPGLRRLIDPTGDVRAFPRIRTEIKTFRPDIVHTHLTKAGVLGRLAALSLGPHRPKLVHTFHGHVLYGILSPRATAAAVAVERFLAGRTDSLMSVGSRVRDELLAAGVGRPDQYRVVPPGVDLPEPPPREEARRALELPERQQVVTFVGRLSVQKRPDRFVEVARACLSRRPDTVFLVVGGGDLEEITRSQASDLGDRIRFLGWRSDIATILGATDVAVLTSDNEGMPVALIEAGMAGVASVATDVGSTGEVVLDGVSGLVRPPETAPLVEAIVELLEDDDLRRRMGAAAREHCRGTFGVARLARDVTSVYEALAG